MIEIYKNAINDLKALQSVRRHQLKHLTPKDSDFIEVRNRLWSASRLLSKVERRYIKYHQRFEIIKTEISPSNDFPYLDCVVEDFESGLVFRVSMCLQAIRGDSDGCDWGCELDGEPMYEQTGVEVTDIRLLALLDHEVELYSEEYGAEDFYNDWMENP